MKAGERERGSGVASEERKDERESKGENERERERWSPPPRGGRPQKYYF